MLHIIFIRTLYGFCWLHLALIIDSQMKNLISLQENDGELFMRTLSLETTSRELLESSPTQTVSAWALPARVIKKELFMKNNEQGTKT